MLTFDELIRRPPLIHNERTITWGILPALAELLDRHVEAGMVTLETGAGLSTLIILRKRPRLHVAVQPNADEFTVIAEFADQHGIDTRPFRGVLARSQHYLPTAELPALDLVLIDGDHSFPAPFVDWYYTADRLKVGGLMIVDDIRIGTGAILANFLSADPKWEEVVAQPERFAVYRKRIDYIHLGDWLAQPFLRDAYPTAGVRLLPSGDPSFLSGKEARALREEARVREEELERARQLLNTVSAERDQATDTARRSADRILAMESTKFWKLRGVWFRCRRLVGLPGDE